MTTEEAEQVYKEGATVVYANGTGREETGKITGVGVVYAFVRYGADSRSKATLIADLQKA